MNDLNVATKTLAATAGLARLKAVAAAVSAIGISGMIRPALEDEPL
jgi:hypothetical protein|tara:strand:+ start:210 stop:347 length:138 start_codon:yes stop_codon:yes gene_type:complete